MLQIRIVPFQLHGTVARYLVPALLVHMHRCSDRFNLHVAAHRDPDTDTELPAKFTPFGSSSGEQKPLTNTCACQTERLVTKLAKKKKNNNKNIRARSSR